jgi:predicted ArsR family transcriptional regulator
MSFLRSLLGDTKSKVFNYLLNRKRNAGEVATKFDIQLNAARKHLESLKSKGLVKEEHVIDGVGRPKKFYTPTGIGRELVQNQSSTLLNLVLGEISSKKGSADADEVIRQVAKEIAGPMRVVESGRREQVASLIESLDKFGFESGLEEDDRSYTIISRHCPIWESAKNHQRLICHGLHDEIIKNALGIENLKLVECMVLDGNVCRHVISKQE